MKEKEKFNQIIEQLREQETSVLHLEGEKEFSYLEGKVFFLIRSVREETFREILTNIHRQAPNGRIYILGRRGDDVILKQILSKGYQLFEVDGDKAYDVSDIKEILDKIKMVPFDACFFMTQKSIGLGQINLMEVLCKIPCSTKGVITNQCKIYLSDRWEQYFTVKEQYDELCNEIWEMYD